jgi:hypothetical protein
MTWSRSHLRNLLFAGGIAVVLSGTATVVTQNYIATTVADQVEACTHDYASVRAGLDAYMANNSLASVPATESTDDMTAPIRLYVKTPTAANPSYVPSPRTRWAYTWDDKGRITAISEASQGGPVPAGCVVAGP